MTYSPIHGAFLITEKELQSVAIEIKYAMRNARALAGIGMGKRHIEGLTRLDHLEKGLLDMARDIGIDFGVQWGNELDLRNDEEIASSEPRGEEPR